MRIWGKIIGALLGYLFFRQAGVVLGLLVGHYFDKGLSHSLNYERNRNEAVRELYFKATFLMMGYLSKIDGTVQHAEIEAARTIMHRLGLSESLRQDAMHLFNKGKSANFDLGKTLRDLWTACSGHVGLLHLFIETQLEVALADGPLTPKEKNLLLYMCKQLRCPPHLFEELYTSQFNRQSFYQSWQSYHQHQQQGESHQQRQHHSRSSSLSLDKAYSILGVQPSATEPELKKAYRRLMNQHHPDKLVGKGLPPHMVKLAEEKTQQIRAAYDAIREARGFR